MTTVSDNVEDLFECPSISLPDIKAGRSYTYLSEIPNNIANDRSAEVTLGVDEAGRGPVLGPMVYAVAYCLSNIHSTLSQSGFDDSKKLTADSRLTLMKVLCNQTSEMSSAIGWAVRVMSPQDISSGMLRPIGTGVYNLNAQAHDTTIQLIRDVLAKGVNVKEIYVDTVGPVTTYQAKLARLFPTCAVTVAKKADSLYPSVSAASVVAKVTRDIALELSLKVYEDDENQDVVPGSGYPSDGKTVTWLKHNLNPIFGWGIETRFSWSTAADLLKKEGVPVEWLDEDSKEAANMASFILDGSKNSKLNSWYGRSVGEAEF